MFYKNDMMKLCNVSCPTQIPKTPRFSCFGLEYMQKHIKLQLESQVLILVGFPNQGQYCARFSGARYADIAHHTMLHISGGDLKVRSHFHTSFIRCSAHHAYFVLCWVLLVKNCLKIFSTSWCHLPCICNCLELEPVILHGFC